MYGWMDWFRQRVDAARERELAAHYKRRVWKAGLSFIGNIAPLAVSLAVFVAYATVCVAMASARDRTAGGGGGAQ